MSVYKKIQLPSKVMCSAAAMSSADEEIAIATDEGVYILIMLAAPAQVPPEFVVHISKIDVESTVNEFDVGIPREDLQRDIVDSCEIVGDFFEVMLNRTLSPAVESLQSNRGFTCVRWSPAGADRVGRRVLATITGDHRLAIFTRHGTAKKWTQVVRVSNLFQDLMKAEQFLPAEERLKIEKEPQKSKIGRLKERTYLLAAVVLCWSPSFDVKIGDTSEPPTKKQKTASESSNKNSTTPSMAFLATATRSGHVGIWKVRFPVLSDCDVTFSELVDLHTKCPKSIHWCTTQDRTPGFLAVGYHDGLVRLLPLLWLDDTKTDLTAGDKPCDVWDETDNIPIYALDWDAERNIVYFGKGPYLFAVVVERTSSGEFTLFKESHIAISSTVFVSEIKLQGDSVWVSSADDVVIKIRVTLNTKKDITFILGTPVDPPRDVSGPLYPWRNHGFTLSRNGAFTGVLSSPGWNYCHLDIRTPLKYDLMCRITPEEAVDRLLDARPETRLTELTDILIYTKQQYVASGSLHEILDMMVKDMEGWDHLHLFNLKLLRFLLQIEDANCKEDPERKKELEALIPQATDRVLCSASCQSLRTIQPRFTNPDGLTRIERLTLSLLCRWVKTHAIEDEDKQRAKEVERVLGKVVKEECTICHQEIPFDSIQSGACSNGHRFGRCSQTLVLCQDVPYRVCAGCGTLAIHKPNKDSPLLKDILTNACCLCDNTLLLL